MNEVTLKALEMGRFRPTAENVRQLLAHPAMARLPELARKAGLELPKDDPDSAGKGSP